MIDLNAPSLAVVGIEVGWGLELKRDPSTSPKRGRILRNILGAGKLQLNEKRARRLFLRRSVRASDRWVLEKNATAKNSPKPVSRIFLETWNSTWS